jgi:IS605 OrfB family transposase
VAYLKQMQERRKQYQRDAKASGRSGRGRKRILRPIEHLSGKARRWRHTKCQTIARRLAKWLDDRGVKTLLVEDFTGIRDSDIGNEHINQLIQEWPYFELETRIRSCCEEHGIEVVKLPANYISQRCPRCGHTGKENQDFNRWRLHCTSCGFKQHLDVAAATNLLGADR